MKPVLVPEEQKKPPYKITGIRDPFQPFARSAQGELSEEQTRVMDPLQKLSISQIELVGIITGKEKRALIRGFGMGIIKVERSSVRIRIVTRLNKTAHREAALQGLHSA